MKTVTKKETEIKSDETTSKSYRLMLHNDDYNTFDWVITCLIRICGHSNEQATQCANIVHYKGKCDVKYGTVDVISVMKEKLINAGLSVTMEIA